jgi:S-DNA-T family DNA segregation ATPase FtsK/SpoIIIE
MQRVRPGAKPSVQVHRAPRKWPYIPDEPISIQTIQPPSKPPATTLLVTGASVIGLLLAAFAYSRFGGSSSLMMIGFLGVSGLSLVASLVVFVVQRASASGDTRRLMNRYSAYLDTTEKTIATLSADELGARRDNAPTIADMARMLARHPERAWQRLSIDPDFLEARIGMGDAPAWLRVQLADHASPYAPLAKDPQIQQLQLRAQHIAEQYLLANDVPITISLREHAAIALINGAQGVAGASALARALVGQVALHHAPNEVQIVVFAPQSSEAVWLWFSSLPTADGSWQGLACQADEQKQRLTLLLAELSRRQQAHHDRGGESLRRQGAPLPHLLIVMDSFAERPETDPLMTPALALALQQGKELGATVVSVHSALSQAPTQAALAVDVAHRRILPLGPNPPAGASCTSLDSFSPEDGQMLTEALGHLQLEAQASLDVPERVRLLSLMNPPINRPEDYPIIETWKRNAQQADDAERSSAFVIPLGCKVGQEPVYLDFVNDGPHGLLIGQTGSGKSELLRSLIAALAIQCSPEQVNFVLVDYKGGLAFDTFRSLPHTVAYLTNMVNPGQTNRFLAMLDAEIVRRQAARARQQAQPELFVIIDEFAEMVSRRSASDTSEVVLDNLLSIARLGRELGVHLLFAAQRPDGNVIQRLRGYVQYRICLRTNTSEDSRDVINVSDASQLPVELPGRGYLLRGDNELTLFQAARITVPSFQSGMMALPRAGSTSGRVARRGAPLKTADRIIAERMEQLTDSPTATRWPVSLPAPTLQTPTPLALAAGAVPRAETLAWSQGQHPPLRALEIPLGLYDRPTEQRQEWFIADLLGHAGRMHGGPLLVMGDLNAGKTTTLQTLLFFLANSHRPADLRWFILNPNSSLAAFAALPHAVDTLEAGVRNVIDGQEEAEFRAFASRFERAAQQDAGRRPALLLVVDDYDELGVRYGKSLHDLANLAIRRRDRGAVYLVLSAARPTYDGLPQAIINSMATRIALYTNDRDQLRSVISGRVPSTLDPIPGRGLVQTRRTLDAIQVAVPIVGKDDAERMERLEEGISQAAQRWQ